MINPFNAIAKSKVDTDKIGILISDRLIIGCRDKSVGWVSLGWQLVKRYPAGPVVLSVPVLVLVRFVLA